MVDTKSNHGGVIGAMISLLLVIGTAWLLLFFLLGEKVPPGYIGVRINHFGIPGILHNGVADVGLQPGLQWKIPGISEIKMIPKVVQYIHFSDTEKTGDHRLGTLEIPTRDGSRVRVEATLLVRYFDAPGVEGPHADTPASAVKQSTAEGEARVEVPFAEKAVGKHGGPEELIRSYGSELKSQYEQIAQIAENELRSALSELTTSDFYNPEKRERAANTAQRIINARLNPNGVEVMGTLIRRYIYADKNIDDQIFAKNLQDQTEQLNRAKSGLSAAKAETEKERAQWDAKISNLVVRGEAKARVLKSEGDLEESKRTAEGNLTVSTARSEVDTAKAKALAESAGSENYVAKEMVPLLETLKGGVVTGVNPYDVEAWVKRITSGGNTHE